MGLAASQARLLSLVARKSDLEYQGQVINSRRLQLAYKTSEIARAYSDGMNDMQIMQSQTVASDNSTVNSATKDWKVLDLATMSAANYMIAGEDGRPIDSIYDADGKIVNNKVDLQNGLQSGKYQIVTKGFYMYAKDIPKSGDNGKTLDQVIEGYRAKEGNNSETPWGIDWRSDTTSTFKEKYYTDNDEAVAAQYEADSAEVQAQDKRLEVELKNIETQHKAIETEYEAVKKVIDKNIETSFKTFG